MANILSKQLGPFPLGGWLAIGGAGVGIAFLATRGSKKPAGVNPVAIDGTSGETFENGPSWADLLNAYKDGLADGWPGSDGPDWTPTTPNPTTPGTQPPSWNTPTTPTQPGTTAPTPAPAPIPPRTPTPAPAPTPEPVPTAPAPQYQNDFGGWYTTTTPVRTEADRPKLTLQEQVDRGYVSAPGSAPIASRVLTRNDFGGLVAAVPIPEGPKVRPKLTDAQKAERFG